MRADDGSAFVTGLQRCGNVHACPVCSERIARERTADCVSALKQWRAAGGHTYMLTLTLPHQLHQSLRDVLNAVTVSTRAINSGRGSMKTLLKPYGYIGQIRALEVTHGENGWHPHLHVLVLVDQEVPAEVVDVIKARWEAAAIAAQWAPPSWTHGATWQGGDAAAEYVSKGGWGMAEEISMGHVAKSGNSGSRTPFEILQDAALGCADSARLFREYGLALHGRRQQFWSRGLKDRFGIKERSDQDVVEEEETRATQEVAVILCIDWRLVVRYEQRAELLRAVESAGQAGVELVVSWLRQRQRDDAYRTLERRGIHKRI